MSVEIRLIFEQKQSKKILIIIFTNFLFLKKNSVKSCVTGVSTENNRD